ncbi:unnamed protein product, partial [Prorocentrum cordatum]
SPESESHVAPAPLASQKATPFASAPPMVVAVLRLFVRPAAQKGSAHLWA